jgi:hypothetical protein
MEGVDLVQQFVYQVLFFLNCGIGVVSKVTTCILLKKFPADGTGREECVIAVETGPFGKVIHDVEGCGAGHGVSRLLVSSAHEGGGASVLIVDKTDGFNSIIVRSRVITRVDDNVRAEKVAMTEHHLSSIG